MTLEVKLRVFPADSPAANAGSLFGEGGEGEHGEGGQAAADCQCEPTLDHSFILSNIARLITPSGRTKSGFLSDQAQLKNADYVAVCETWLHDGVKDAEVTIDFPDYTIFRADRGLGRDGTPRVGGGVALYLKEEFSGDCLVTYDNGVVEMLIVKIHQLDTIVIVLYRSPDTAVSELKGALDCLDERMRYRGSPAKYSPLWRPEPGEQCSLMDTF